MGRAVHGRERELTVLDEVLSRARDGSGGVVVIEGDAGIGKSALVDAVQERAAALGFDLAAAEGEELEAARPFGLLLRALGCSTRSPDDRRAGIARLASAGISQEAVPILGTSHSERFVVQDALVDLVEDLAIERPLLVALDDLQWADPGSLGTLAAVVRRARTLRVALVLSLRPWPRRAELDALVERCASLDVPHLRLSALDDHAVAAIVDELVGAQPKGRLAAAVTAAAGNPFYVRELIRSAETDGLLQRSGGEVDLAGPELGTSFRERILRRLAALPAGTLELLRVGAVMGPAFDVRDIAAVTGEAVVPLHQAAHSAQRAGLVVEHPDGHLGFQHDLVREAIYRDLPSTVRAALHAEIAATLIRRGAPATTVAPHLVAGAVKGDGQAVTWLRAAARETAPHDPVAAASLLETALDLCAADEPDRAHLLSELATSLRWAGRFHDANERSEAALALTHDPVLLHQLRIGRAETHLLRGRVSAAADPIRAAAEQADTPDEERALLWAEVCSCSLWTLDFAECERAGERAIALGTEHGVALALAMANGVLARLYTLRGDMPRALRHAEQGVAATRRDPSAERALPRFYQAMALTRVDAPAAIDVYLEGLRRAERGGIGWGVALIYMALPNACFEAGRWDDCITYYETGRALQEERDAIYEPASAATVGVALFYRGDLARARATLAEAKETLRRTSNAGSLVFVRWLEATLLEHDGDVEGAATMLLDMADACDSFGVANVSSTWMAEVLGWAMNAGLTDRVERHVASMNALAELGQTPFLRGQALRCQAVVADDPDLFCAALEHLRVANEPYAMALACEQAGLSLAASGRLPEARAVFGEGLQHCEAMGAALLTRRMTSHLRAAGGAKGVRGTRARPATGWDSLTQGEHQILALLPEGLTNAEIGQRLYISRRTVETHLGHIYGKLGVSSRAAVAAAAAERRR